MKFYHRKSYHERDKGENRGRERGSERGRGTRKWQWQYQKANFLSEQVDTFVLGGFADELAWQFGNLNPQNEEFSIPSSLPHSLTHKLFK